MKKKYKHSQNIIVHDYLQNYGGGERLIKILSKKKFHYLFVGFDQKIFKKFFKNRNIKFKKLITDNLPNIVKKLILIRTFKKTHFKCRNYICSGSYAVFAKVEAKNKIVYIHSLPKIFFRSKNFYSKSSMIDFFTDNFFYNFKKEYLTNINSFDHIICNSLYTKRQLSKFISKKINVIYPPIENLKKKKKIRFENFFVFNNRHEKEKNLDKVLIAFSKMRNENLIVLSEGSLTSIYKKKYLKYTNIKFTGIVNDEKYGDYLSRCYATINVSINEDFGMGALEGMQFGKITFCLNNGGYKETTINNYNSIHINPNNISDDLIKKIKQCKNLKITKFKKNCFNTFKKFNEKKFVRSIYKLLI